MPAFNYTALENNGKETKGVLEGDTARQIRQQLRLRGLMPLEVIQVAKKNKRTVNNFSFSSLRYRTSFADLALLTRQLATMLSASIPLEEAILSVADQSEKNHIRSMMMAVRARVLEGFSLAQALQDFPQVFSKLYRATIAAGEKTGRLDLVLERLADFSERQHEVRQKILQALIYPTIIIFASISIVIFLLSYVVPKMITVFQNNGQVLPDATLALIAISHFIQAYGIYVIIALILASILWWQLLKKPEIRYAWHNTILRLPLFGRTSRLINTSRFAHTLAILTAAGVEVIDALNTATETINNLVIQKSFQNAARQVREGVMIFKALKETRYFPAMSIHLIASGENSGRLEQMLQRAALNQERDVERRINILLTLFEPIIILIMGSIVLFIVLAILLPIFNLDQLVK
jgi:general secretion pathway protein F